MEAERRRRLGDRVALEHVDAPLGVADPPADRAGDVLPLEVVDELVAVARRAAVRHLPGGGRGRLAQRGELVLLGLERGLPAPPRGALGGQVGGVPAGEPVAALAVDAEVGRVEVDHGAADRVEERPVVAGDHGDPGQRDQELLEQRGGLVVEVVGGLVEQHAAGPPGDQRGQREAAALPAGHGAPPAGAGRASPRPSRAAASSARRSASQASCRVAQVSVASYSSAAPGSSSSGASSSSRATASCSGARAASSTSPMVAPSGKSGSWAR